MQTILNKNIGIYSILNLENNKRYIGQTVSFYHRELHHFGRLEANQHICTFLQRAYNKYGPDNFKFEILEICNKEQLTEREQFWMDFYKPAGIYNLAPAAGCLRGHKQSAETIAKRVVKLKGKKRSDEVRKKFSAILLGKPGRRKGTIFTDETRLKMSVAKLGRRQSPEHIAKRISARLAKVKENQILKLNNSQ